MNDKSYTNWISMSDVALIKTIGEFVQSHRIKQNRTQDEVAGSAGISRSTLSLLERGENVALNSLIQVLRTLDLLYIFDIFKIEQQVSPIALAKLAKQKRQRASKKDNEEQPESDW
ncbi:MAG TPA: helix-turn-helix transcriptional regulator [Lutibacter sp.]